MRVEAAVGVPALFSSLPTQGPVPEHQRCSESVSPLRLQRSGVQPPDGGALLFSSLTKVYRNF